MNATFVELPPFARLRETYLEADDLSTDQRKALKGRLELEIKVRSTKQ
ncbi:hypothetical protein [Massilia brevitalea]|nr:hypothetical protein [Massilia brevitalea]